MSKKKNEWIAKDELQIGCLVRLQTPNDQRGLHINLHWGAAIDSESEYHFPIELTEEIVQKNLSSEWYWSPYSKVFWTRKGDIIHDIKTVHQLQIALKLCGMKDLANNIRVDQPDGRRGQIVRFKE